MAYEGSKRDDGDVPATTILLPKEQYHQLISSLPSYSYPPQSSLRNYHGFWYREYELSGGLAFRDHFKARDTDILLVSSPKSGTTWLKALAFTTVNRKQHSPFAPDHPLLSIHPQDCIPYANRFYVEGKGHKLEELAPPRLVNLHQPYSFLPDSVKSSSGCKIVYLCRNPKDNLVSAWHFIKRMVKPAGVEQDPISFDEFYERYCKGISPNGPVWDHNLEYWSESLRRPEVVLFLKYEDLMEEPAANVRKLAEFMGCPFSEEEEREGIVEGIVKLCSFDNLTSLEVNQKGDRGLNKISSRIFNLTNSSFFRKGKVGDWKNHLTPEMAQRLDEITEEKFSGSGLSFRQNYI